MTLNRAQRVVLVVAWGVALSFIGNWAFSLGTTSNLPVRVGRQFSVLPIFFTSGTLSPWELLLVLLALAAAWFAGVYLLIGRRPAPSPDQGQAGLGQGPIVTWKVRGHGYWFVPFVFGLATIGAVGFYGQVNPCPNGEAGCAFALTRFTAALLTTGLSPMQAGNHDRAGIYWLVAIPATLVLAVAFFARRRRPQPVWNLVPVAIGGLAILAVLMALGFARNGPREIFPGDFTVRGLVGLVILSLTMLVMSAVERNGTLALASAGAVGVAFLANLYDIENVSGDFGSNQTAANLIVPAIYFLLAALLLALPDLVAWTQIALARSDAPKSAS